MTADRPGPTRRVAIRPYRDGQPLKGAHTDAVATEEPLEIRLKAGREQQTVAITMRTPGNDFELAAGFLFSEGVIRSRHDLKTITYCVDRDLAESQRYNVVNVSLRAATLPPLGALDRHYAVNSACGVCGKTSLDAVERCQHPVESSLRLDPAVVVSLPGKLRDHQKLFATTGGLHAAALFSAEGDLRAVREDVGRHNALDKLIGQALMEDTLPLGHSVLLVSGRASFELVQKAAAAGIPALFAISAPSSLAVDLAARMNITLAGFLRGDSFNVYAGEERLNPG